MEYKTFFVSMMQGHLRKQFTSKAFKKKTRTWKQEQKTSASLSGIEHNYTKVSCCCADFKKIILVTAIKFFFNICADKLRVVCLNYPKLFTRFAHYVVIFFFGGSFRNAPLLCNVGKWTLITLVKIISNLCILQICINDARIHQVLVPRKPRIG